jgi:hypothetical protein
MRLFGRKAMSEDEPERCPFCREPLPDGAAECVMCGSRLPHQATSKGRPAEPVEANPPDG